MNGRIVLIGLYDDKHAQIALYFDIRQVSLVRH